jgi:hypothetical protein
MVYSVKPEDLNDQLECKENDRTQAYEEDRVEKNIFIIHFKRLIDVKQHQFIDRGNAHQYDKKGVGDPEPGAHQFNLAFEDIFPKPENQNSRQESHIESVQFIEQPDVLKEPEKKNGLDQDIYIIVDGRM